MLTQQQVKAARHFRGHYTSRVRLILGLRSDTVSLFNEMLSLLVSMGTNVTVWGTEDIREVAGVRYVPAETQASSTLLQELIMAGVDVPERVIIVPAMDAVLDALRQTKLQPGLDDLKTLLNPAVGNGVLTATVYNDIEFKRFLEKLGANARCSFIIGLTDQAAKAIRAEKWFKSASSWNIRRTVLPVDNFFNCWISELIFLRLQ